MLAAVAELADRSALGEFDHASDEDVREMRKYAARLFHGFQTRAAAVASPVAEIVHVESRPATRVVVVRCPFAAMHSYRGRGHQFHVHGWPYGQSDPGHRVPHCDNDPGGLYRLQPPELAPDARPQ